MDLTLALGRPIGGMSEREFARWSIYARRKSFPLRRIEFCLANIAMKIDQFMGVTNRNISDYLFNPTRDESGRMVDPKEVYYEDDF